MRDEPKNRVDFELKNKWFNTSNCRRRLVYFRKANTKNESKAAEKFQQLHGKEQIPQLLPTTMEQNKNC